MQDTVFAGHSDAFEHSTLTSLGEQMGVPAAESREVLTNDRYADAVRADHARARVSAQREFPSRSSVDSWASPAQRPSR
ncbi:MAG: hypothetical protein ACTH2Q_17115 [Propionibacteriaceae bacterium]